MLLKPFDLDRYNYSSWDQMTFIRPFKAFALYETEIRALWNNLEEKRQNKEQWPEFRMPNKPKNGDSVLKENFADEAGIEQRVGVLAAQEAVMTNTNEALRHLRYLINLFDKELKPMFDLRTRLKARIPCAIAFADLWHLYEHGQEVRTSNSNLQIYKVAKFTGGRDLLYRREEAIESDRLPASCYEREKSNGSFFIECFRYDFDRICYGPVREIFEIRRYESLEDVRSLTVYPLCFDFDYEKVRNHLMKRGEKFVALSRDQKTSHKSYFGTSVDDHAEEVRWTSNSEEE